jgi:hypothetical protein
MSLALEKLFLYPEFSYVQQILPFPSKCVENSFRSKVPLLKSRHLNVLGYTYHRLFFPHDQVYVAFSQTSCFDHIAVASVEGRRQGIGSHRLISLDIVYREEL